jgi:hypothetical protein
LGWEREREDQEQNEKAAFHRSFLRMNSSCVSLRRFFLLTLSRVDGDTHNVAHLRSLI